MSNRDAAMVVANEHELDLNPIFDFIVLHCLYRVGPWWRTLWMISRLDLQLRGSHPDDGGGILFLRLSLVPFRWPTFALACSVAGGLANLFFATGVSALRFKPVIGIFAALITVILAGPLFFFRSLMSRAKFRAWLSYDEVVPGAVAAV